MSKKALVIEDVFANRYLLTYLLTNNGWDVAEAEDGESALRVATEYVPDVILLDVGLPEGIIGYSLIQPLRAIHSLRNVPIIAVTSYAMGGDREAAFAAGCNGYIEKPIDPERFISQIEAIMR